MTTGHRVNGVSGFTLVELLVTISVASVLLVAAVPAFNGIVVSNRLTAQTNDMIAAINYSRSDAIKRNSTVTLCRAGSASDTSCVTSDGAWQYWIVRTAAGTVARRGSINTYGGTLSVRSSALTLDRVDFSSDGLARTDGALLNDGAGNNRIDVCVTRAIVNNIRGIVLGAGSRVSTEPSAGAC